MTREEQIDWLCRLRTDLNNGVIFTPWNKEFTEALNDVLDQEPILDELRAEIMQVANQEKFYDEKWALGLRYAVKIIDKYRAESENTDGNI